VIDVAYDTGYESLSGFNEALRQLAGVAPKRAGREWVVTVTRFPTPLGPMIAAATEEALCLLEFVDRRMLQTELERVTRLVGGTFAPGENRVLRKAAKEGSNGDSGSEKKKEEKSTDSKKSDTAKAETKAS